MHPLLHRQLARLGLSPDTPPSPEAWRRFLERVDTSYGESDEARYLLERALEVSSTEMFELYEKLRASSESLVALERDKLQAVLGAVAAGVVTMDLAYRIESLNPAGEHILGYKSDELSGADVRTIFNLTPSSPPRSERGSAQRSRDRESTMRDAVAKAKDGRAVPIGFAITPVRKAEMPVGAVLVFVDLTERLRAERYKNEFVSMVSHEVRTPLTSMRGALKLLNAGLAGPLPETAEQLVSIAGQSAERLVRLVNDILDMEKIESGLLEFRMGACDLRALVGQAVADIRPHAAESNVAVEQTESAESSAVHIDADRILQVLSNLLSNALKFSPEGSTVRVRILSRAANARVEIDDSGPGVPDDLRNRIFGKFVQGGEPSVRAKGGTGLGLNISKAIVDRHGGQIGYLNRPGGGATFFFEIPFAVAHSPSTEKATVSL